MRPDVVVQIGLPPRRSDSLSSITGAEFESARTDRVARCVNGREVRFLGRATLIQNKRAAGRDKDRADLVALGEAP